MGVCQTKDVSNEPKAKTINHRIVITENDPDYQNSFANKNYHKEIEQALITIGFNKLPRNRYQFGQYYKLGSDSIHIHDLTPAEGASVFYCQGGINEHAIPITFPQGPCGGHYQVKTGEDAKSQFDSNEKLQLAEPHLFDLIAKMLPCLPFDDMVRPNGQIGGYLIS